MPQVIDFTLAVGVWVPDGRRPSAAIIGMRPTHLEAMGVNVPDEIIAPGFPEIPERKGIWIVTCSASLPAYLDDEDLSLDEILSAISLSQIAWDPDTAVWRMANARDLYILRGERPPTNSEGPS